MITVTSDQYYKALVEHEIGRKMYPKAFECVFESKDVEFKVFARMVISRCPDDDMIVRSYELDEAYLTEEP